MKTRTIITLLCLTNAVTLAALFAVSMHYGLPQRLLLHSGPVVQSVPGDFTDNPWYHIHRSYYSAYKPRHTTTVMLGDSLTSRINWNELLSRTDFANRGIPSDTTEGMKSRLADIYEMSPRPETCMIMGGINDLSQGRSTKEIYENLVAIAEDLRANGIVPVLQSTLFVASSRKSSIDRNSKVAELNSLLSDYANRNGIKFIDVNSELASEGALNAAYTHDGLHLLGSGYEKWREVLRRCVLIGENQRLDRTYDVPDR